MATIVIKDLPESTELDRKAMLAIAGGSRFRAGTRVVGRAGVPRVRLFDLSADSAGKKPPTAKPPSR
jgi:hypothetical protein